MSSPILLQPLTAVTSDTGSYQFPRLKIGTYTVKFELAGFKTVVNEGVRVTVGFSAQVNAQLGISTVQETVTVSGESRVVDTKETGTKQTFTNELLQSIPSARDPWVILQQTAGIAMDRENVGGNMSGQQSNYVSRGGNPFNNKWSLDGIDITDMAATGPDGAAEHKPEGRSSDVQGQQADALQQLLGEDPQRARGRTTCTRSRRRRRRARCRPRSASTCGTQARRRRTSSAISGW